jgi:hypothetical protein
MQVKRAIRRDYIMQPIKREARRGGSAFGGSNQQRRTSITQATLL